MEEHHQHGYALEPQRVALRESHIAEPISYGEKNAYTLIIQPRFDILVNVLVSVFVDNHPMIRQTIQKVIRVHTALARMQMP